MFAKAVAFLGICWCTTLICLLTSLWAHCLSPPDQIALVTSVQNHFLIKGEKEVISSCAQPTKTLTVPCRKCHCMNSQSTKAENLNSSKSYCISLVSNVLVSPCCSTKYLTKVSCELPLMGFPPSLPSESADTVLCALY